MLVTSDQVATSIVIAAWRLGEDPIFIAGGVGKSSRARWHAFAGLLAAFVDVDREYAAQSCGFERGKPSMLAYRNLKANVGRMKWYEPAVVREIVATLVPVVLISEPSKDVEKSDIPSETGITVSSSSPPRKPGRATLNMGTAAARAPIGSYLPPRQDRDAREPNPNRFAGFADERPRGVPEQGTKADLARMLAEAVKNTAKLQDKVR